MKAVAAGTNPDQPLASERIRELRQSILPLAYNAYDAKKGWRNISELHDETFRFVREVDRVADLRTQLAIEEDSEKKALQEKINTLEAALKEKDEIIASQGAYIESLENSATPGCSKNIPHTKSSTLYGRDSDLEQRRLQTKPTPSYSGIFASVKLPSESDSESIQSGTSRGISISIPSGWGD